MVWPTLSRQCRNFYRGVDPVRLVIRDAFLIAARGIAANWLNSRRFSAPSARSYHGPDKQQRKDNARGDKYAETPCLKSRSRFLLLCTPSPAANTLLTTCNGLSVSLS